MMKKASACLMLLLLFSCGAAVKIPEDKQDYIGDWRGDTISLSIAPRGYVSYERQQGGFSESISGPITKFDGNSFTVGILALSKTFQVTDPPVTNGEVWKMTVNGEVVEKTDNRANRTVPDQNALVALVNDSFVVFAACVDRKNFGYFYQNISRLWQSHTTADDIQAAFQSFIDNGIDLRNVTKKRLVFSNKPYIDEDNVLVLEGYYPTDPLTRFTLRYVYEHPRWMLAGFSCRIE
jgi:hypothetical protein